MFRRALAALACILTLASAANAQEQRGSLEGTLRDAQGAVLPGVIVEVRSPALIGVHNATTDANGTYRFPGAPSRRLPVDGVTYRLSATKAPPVQLSVGQTLKVGHDPAARRRQRVRSR